MSSLSRATVVQIETLEKHPKGDNLAITYCDGFLCVVGKDDFKIGDLAIYVPVDLVVSDEPEFSFLKPDDRRIRGQKRRGIVSFGLLVKARPHHKLGDDVTEELRITKHEFVQGGDDLSTKPPSGQITYTDIDSLRKYKRELVPGEEVVIEEKIHGENYRGMYRDGILHMGTNVRWIKDDGVNNWSVSSKKLQLKEKLSAYPNFTFFGELYGHIGRFPYDQKNRETSVRFFDIFDPDKGVYLNYGKQVEILEKLDLKRPPLLYIGPWDVSLLEKYGSGQSMIGNHIKEGIVVRPIEEKYNENMVGRLILKYHSPLFMTGK